VPFCDLFLFSAARAERDTDINCSNIVTVVYLFWLNDYLFYHTVLV